MNEFDAAAGAEPAMDAETMLTPIKQIGPTPRAQMVRKLADIVVLPSGQVSANERSLIADILLQVLDKVEMDLRIEVAKRIARVPESPPSLVRMLILDEPEVASELIQRAEAVPEALLIEAAREGQTAHRVMIAKRIDLTTSVADAVLAEREFEVCMQVLKRDDVTLSPNAINVLVALSATKDELQLPLLRRHELEPAHGFMMFWWVEKERRKRILTRFSLSRTIIQDALADLYPKVFRGNGNPDPFVKEILILSERRHRPRGANGEPVSMEVVLRTLVAARKYPTQEIIEAVGLIAGVTRELAARILRDTGGESFAVMCKSLGVPRENFFEIVSVRREGDETPPELQAKHAEYLLEVFDRIARDYSRAVLRYWDWDGNPRIAFITRLLGLADDDVE